MGKRRRTKFEESARNNDLTFIQYVNALTELATTMFEWKNLPDTIDERFMELTLFSRGSAVFFKDEVMGFLCLPCLIKGRLDVYRIPIDRQAFSVNGYRKNLNNEEQRFVPINNATFFYVFFKSYTLNIFHYNKLNFFCKSNIKYFYNC